MTAIPGKLSWAGALVALLSPGIAAAAAPPAFVPLGAAADAPAGFVELCTRDLALCQAGIGESSPAAAMVPARAPSSRPATGLGTGTIVSSPPVARASRRPLPAMAPTDDLARLTLLRRINAAVNAQVVQLPDSVTAGVDERWDRPGEVGRPAGDCEDIAIEKRARLLEAGFAPDRLFFAVVYRTGFGLHTVLVARLDGGDQVLDSAERDVKPWTRTRYVWLRAQAPGAPMCWQRVALPGRPNRA